MERLKYFKTEIIFSKYPFYIILEQCLIMLCIMFIILIKIAYMVFVIVTYKYKIYIIDVKYILFYTQK